MSEDTIISAPSPLGRAFRLGLRAALGLAAVAWVLTQVQWHDRVLLADGPAWTEGRIVSDRLREEGRLLFRESGSAEARLLVPSDLHRPDGLGPDRPYAPSSLQVGLAYIGQRARWTWLVLGVLLVSVQYLVTPARWALLLRALSVPLRLPWVLGLNLMGNFAANVLPGGTAAGDVLKAVYAWRLSGRGRAEAALTVFVDRFLGFLGMVVLGTAALWAHAARPDLRTPAWICLAAAGLLGLAGLVLLSPRLQNLLGVESLLRRLPGRATIERLRGALFAFRRQRRALLGAGLLSLVNWTLLALANLLLARGLGMDGVAASLFFVAVPAAGLAFLVPFLPGGWGVGEASYAFLFTSLSDASPSVAVALSLVFRLSHTLWSLPGALVFVLLPAARRAALSSETAPS